MSDYRSRTPAQEKEHNQQKNRRFRARRTLWSVISRHPGLRLGELMNIGRNEAMASVEMWPRELKQLIADGDVRIEKHHERESPNREDGRLFVVEGSTRYRR